MDFRIEIALAFIARFWLLLQLNDKVFISIFGFSVAPFSLSIFSFTFFRSSTDHSRLLTLKIDERYVQLWPTSVENYADPFQCQKINQQQLLGKRVKKKLSMFTPHVDFSIKSDKRCKSLVWLDWIPIANFKQILYKLAWDPLTQQKKKVPNVIANRLMKRYLRFIMFTYSVAEFETCFGSVHFGCSNQTKENEKKTASYIQAIIRSFKLHELN